MIQKDLSAKGLTVTGRFPSHPEPFFPFYAMEGVGKSRIMENLIKQRELEGHPRPMIVEQLVSKIPKVRSKMVERMLLDMAQTKAVEQQVVSSLDAQRLAEAKAKRERRARRGNTKKPDT